MGRSFHLQTSPAEATWLTFSTVGSTTKWNTTSGRNLACSPISALNQLFRLSARSTECRTSSTAYFGASRSWWISWLETTVCGNTQSHSRKKATVNEPRFPVFLGEELLESAHGQHGSLVFIMLLVLM